MDDTRCGKNCCFVKSGFCEDDTECPNYIETFWQDNKNGELKTVKDCSPKRALLEQQRMMTAFIGVQASVGNLEKKIQKLEDTFSLLINQSKELLRDLEEKDKHKEIS